MILNQSRFLKYFNVIQAFVLKLLLSGGGKYLLNETGIWTIAYFFFQRSVKNVSYI